MAVVGATMGAWRRFSTQLLALGLLLYITHLNALPVIPPSKDGAEPLEVPDGKRPDFDVRDARHPDNIALPQPGEEIPEKQRNENLYKERHIVPDLERALHDEQGDVESMHQAREAVPVETQRDTHKGVIMDDKLEAPDTIADDTPVEHDSNLKVPDPQDDMGKVRDDVELPEVAETGDEEEGEGAGQVDESINAPDVMINDPKPSDNVEPPEVDDGQQEAAEDVAPNRAARLDQESDDVQAPDPEVEDAEEKAKLSDNLQPPEGEDGKPRHPESHNDNMPIPDNDQQLAMPDGRGAGRRPAAIPGQEIGAGDINELKRMEAAKTNPDTEDGNDQLKFLGHLDGDVADNRLSLSEVKPPDHLDAVHLEADGHLNRDYKKEIFFGNHEDLDLGNTAELSNTLTDIFHKADKNLDNFLTQPELVEWIQQRVEDHFVDDTDENENIFNALDRDKDGFITWREFHVEYLMARGNEEGKAEKHAEDYDTIDLDLEGPCVDCVVVDKKKINEKEQLIRYKFRWADADEEPQDNKITLKEFHFFRHPEQSPKTLLRMVEDIIENIDTNRDFILTEEEFAALPEGEVEEDWQKIDKVWQEERRKEFRKFIDKNGDGEVSQDELMLYVDPRNPNHALTEARNLIQLADENRDQKLSLKEVLNNLELFIGSKMVDTRKSFHDEF